MANSHKMIQRILSILFLFSSTVLLAQNPNPSTSVDDYITDEMLSENAPGMATLIVKDGEIVWLKSYGWADIQNAKPVTDTTVFLLASISKVFTGTALMHLFENGEIDLDEDINNYLPFNIDVPNYVADSITFRMLMTHTSSITDNETVMDTYYSLGDPTISLAAVIERYFSDAGSDYNPAENFTDNAPGTNYEYSNIATALAGYMVEAVTGVDFSQYCKTHIFDKLCMNNTSWYLEDFNLDQVARPYQYTANQYVPYNHYGFADYPDGQLRSTTTDLANFLIAYLQDGSFNGQQLLSSTSINQMLSPQVAALEETQGLNWYLEEIYLTSGGTTNLWGHNGGESGVSTDMYIDRTNNIGVAVISNGEGDNLNVVDELYNYALTLSASGVGNPPCNALSVSNSNMNVSYRMYPNPSTGNFFLETDQQQLGTISIRNSLGQITQHFQTNEQKTHLQITVPGMYFVHISGKEHTHLTTILEVK